MLSDTHNFKKLLNSHLAEKGIDRMFFFFLEAEGSGILCY